jgi:hypothetical protein
VAGEAALPSDQPTHATSMAQTMLTSLQTVTSGGTSVQILPVDVYGNNATTTTFDVALGVTAAVNAGANPINLSLGTSADSEVLHETIRLARAQGVVFFASAGNEAVTTRTLPAAWKEVAAVTAGNADHTIAAWANYGSFVSIVAPGTAIVYYKDQPFVSTGTSTASAYASGMAAGISEVKKVPLSEAQTALQQKLAPVGLGK